jgi:hypothetical protein
LTVEEFVVHSRLEINGEEGNSPRRTQRATELKGKKRRKAQRRQDKKDAGQEIGVPRGQRERR